MLIRRAEIWGRSGRADLRVDQGRIVAIGEIAPAADEYVLDAEGGALLPGLHDHHIHLAALAAKAESVACGPPEVTTPDDLAARLAKPGTGWLRGVGYHESVMGLPTARELDALVCDRPLRIQHRSGRLWLLNSAALDALLSIAEAPPGLDADKGHLFDEDAWLREALGSTPPDFAVISNELLRWGVTGVTDMSPRNDAAMAAHVASQIGARALLQHCRLAGSLDLAGAESGPWTLGEAKLHLHEADLPPFDEATGFIAAAHGQGRAVAVHCVSEVELVFTLAAFEQAGTLPGDRIEHASVADPGHVARIAALGLAVCVQPHFLTERGDRYLVDVEPRHHRDLYRLASLDQAGIVLAGGSDAPFGSADPWAAMAAAVSRTTDGGVRITGEEALSPEQALALYLADPAHLSRQRRIAVGAPSDLCLLKAPWAQARERLTSDDVRATLLGTADDLVHQPPG